MADSLLANPMQRFDLSFGGGFRSVGYFTLGDDLAPLSKPPGVDFFGAAILTQLRERKAVGATLRLGRNLNYYEGEEDGGHESQVLHTCSEDRLGKEKLR